MQNTILGVIDAIGLLLAVTALFLAIKLVIRTEKELDRAAKFLLAASIVLTAANLTSVNDYLGGIIPNDVNRLIFHVSRIFALSFFILAFRMLIKMTEKNQ